MLFNFGATPSNAEPINGRIEGVKIPKLEQSNIPFTGSTVSPTWIDYDETKIVLFKGFSGIDIGTYYAIFRIIDPSKYVWEDGTVGDKEVEWSIGLHIIQSVPNQLGTLTYSGNAQSPTWNNYDDTFLFVSGSTSATIAGDYIAYFTPKENSKWWDGTQESKSAKWTIKPILIEKIPSQNGFIYYNENKQFPTWNDYDENKLSIYGDVSGIDARKYTAVFVPKQNYAWHDGTTTGKEVVWTINRARVTIPSFSGILIYNGLPQVPEFENYDPNKMVMGGDTFGIDIKEYYTTFTPTSNYQWDDGTYNTKTVVWQIYSMSIRPIVGIAIVGYAVLGNDSTTQPPQVDTTQYWSKNELSVMTSEELQKILAL